VFPAVFATTKVAPSVTISSMDDPPDDDVFLDMIESVSVDVLSRIGDDPETRYAFFKRFVAVALETVRQAEAGKAAAPH
jgi:hypothetical protein